MSTPTKAHNPHANRLFSMSLNAVTTLAILLCCVTVRATDGVWTNTSDSPAVWTNSANWLDGNVPGAAGDTATIQADITNAYTIDLAAAGFPAANITLGALTLSDTNSSTNTESPYTIAAGVAGSSITFDNAGNGAMLSMGQESGPGAVDGANDAISAPIYLHDNLTINAQNPELNRQQQLTGGIFQTNGSFAITNIGPGDVLLASSNDYSGGTFIQNGRMREGGSYSWGTGPVVISAGGQAYLLHGTPTNTFYIAGIGAPEWTIVGNTGAIRFQGNTLAGPVILTANARIGVVNTSGTLDGPISGPYELEFSTGTGGTGNNGYNNINVTHGTIICASTNTTAATRLTQFGAATLTIVAQNDHCLSTGPLIMDGGVLELNGHDLSFASITNYTLQSIAGSAQIVNGGGAPATITLGSDNSDFGFSGELDNSPNNSSGAALNLTKVGTGRMTLFNTHLYTGSTTISNGTLALDSSASIGFSSAIKVAPGAVFDVSAVSGFMLGAYAPQTLSAGRSSNFGTDINGSLNLIQGTIQPGDSGAAGTMTINGDLTLSGGALNFDLANATTAGGGTNDLIVVNGTLNLSGSTTINVNWLNRTPIAGRYTLIQANSLGSGSAAANLVLGSGTFANGRASYSLDDTTTPGTIYLVVAGVPGQLVWTNANNMVWDLNTTPNWLNLNTGHLDSFLTGDYTIFNDSPASDANISVVGTLVPSAMTFSNNVRNYTFSDGGSGYLQPSVVNKIGSANVTINSRIDVESSLNLNNGTMRFAPPAYDQDTIYGPITGSGAMAVGTAGAPATMVVNSADNTYSGPITISSGELQAQGNDALGAGQIALGDALTGPTDSTTLTIGSGFSITNSVMVTINAASPLIQGQGGIGGAGSLTMNGTNTLVVTASNTFVGPVTINSGTVQVDIGGNTGTLGSGIITNNSRLVFFRNDQLPWDIANPITGSGTIYFTNTDTYIGSQQAGNYMLSGNNTNFTGAIYVNNSRIRAQGGVNAFGNPAMINVASNAEVYIYDGSTYTQPLSIAGQGWWETAGGHYLGALRFEGGSTWAGPITLTANARIGTYANHGVITGPIYGAGHELEFCNANLTRSGSISVECPTNTAASTRLTSDGGLLTVNDYLDNPAALSTGPLAMGTNTALELVSISNAVTVSFATIDSPAIPSPNITISGAGSYPVTLSVGGNNADFDFYGKLSLVNLTKVGTGNMTLSGTNTYYGATTISSGKLTLDGTGEISDSTPIMVSAGAVFDISASSFTLGTNQTLMGNGTVNGNLAVNSGATLAPGTDAIGTLTITGDTILDANQLSTTVMKVDNNNHTNDLLNVDGTLTYNGTLLITNISGTAYTDNQVIKLFNAGSYAASAFSSIIFPEVKSYDASKLAVDGTITVTSVLPSTPTNLIATITGTQLQLSWPTSYTGWLLQSNAISLLNTNAWVTVPGSSATNQMQFNIDPTQTNVFYRMVYP